MPSIEEIRKKKFNKYMKRIDHLKENKESILKKDIAEKVQFVLERMMTEDAYKWWTDMKNRDYQLYWDVGLNLINPIYDFIDYIIEDILKGKEIKKFKKLDIIKMARNIKGVRNQIKIQRDGQVKTLKETLTQQKESEEFGRMLTKRTFEQDRRNDDENLGKNPRQSNEVD